VGKKQGKKSLQLFISPKRPDDKFIKNACSFNENVSEKNQKMINTIIFSYNRAIQLELLIKSIITYNRHKLLNVSILYSYSDPDHKQGYDTLIKKWPQFNWVWEQRLPERFVMPYFPLYWHNYFWWLKYKHSRSVSGNFRNLLIRMIAESKDELVMFLTDDSMFYKTVAVPEMAVNEIKSNPSKFSFSLRHGTNIFGGNYSSQPAFNWNIYSKQKHPEWSHPFSVDGHIYGKSFMLHVMNKVWFKNPNTLECNLACYIREKKLVSMVYFNKESCLAGFELNRVQNISDNHNLNISNKYLNALFNNGYSMEIKFEESSNEFFRPLKFRVYACKGNELIDIVNTE
jgi:hypothetical protein